MTDTPLTLARELAKTRELLRDSDAEVVRLDREVTRLVQALEHERAYRQDVQSTGARLPWLRCWGRR